MIYDDNDTYIISRINIDSQFINCNNKPVVKEFIKLDKNPFVFSLNSNLIKIKIPYNLNILENNYISIFNVLYPEFILEFNTLYLKKNLNMININHINHNLNNNSLIKINIVTSESYLNIIPINYFLNKIFNISIIDSDNYSIIIDYYPTENISNNFLYKIYLINPNGINLNLINAYYPISCKNLNQYHKVYNIIEDSSSKYLVIEIKQKATSSYEYIFGNNIKLGIIETIYNNFNINDYEITFNKTYYNVEKIKLISTLFPNFESLIHLNSNHKFYWMYLDEPDYIYNIELSSGYLDYNSIKTDIMNKINNTKRIYNKLYYNIINQLNKKCLINISLYNNKFIFEFYNYIYLKNSITILEIQEFPDKHTMLKINQPLHNLDLTDIIKIENSNNLNNIPSNIINSNHNIYKIIDADNYIIKLNFYNPISSNTEEDNIIKIIYPISAKILFLENNSGKILGFNLNEHETEFSKIIKSNNLDNNLGLNSIKTCNYIHNPYILMTSSIFSNEINVKESIGVIAKIYININNDPYAYDRFMQLNINLPTTYHSINKMDFKFLQSSGELFDFNNLNHSFVLEIYEKKIK